MLACAYTCNVFFPMLNVKSYHNLVIYNFYKDQT